jgi:cytoskeleton protein RodZ
MLTPKRNGPGEDFFSDAAPRGTDEPGSAFRKKPLSQILREEREHKNLSLQEVVEITHIPLNYLQLLEGAGDERLVPDSLYLIASLRSYAAFLGIDQGAALTRFISELEQGPAVKEKAGGFMHPTHLLNNFPRQWSRALPRTLILFLLPLGVLAIVGYYSGLTQGPQRKDDKVASLPAPSDSPPTPQSEFPPPVAPPALSASPSDAGQSEPLSPPPAVSPPVTAASQAEPPAVAAPRVETPVVESPSLPQNPSASAPHRLRVQAKTKTWLHVTIDDQPMKRLFLLPGQAVEWSAEQGFTLSLGNAGGVQLTLDGQELPPLGKAGQMVHNVRLPAQRKTPALQGRNADHPRTPTPRFPRR